MSLLIQFKEAPLKRGAWSVDEDNKLVDYIKDRGIFNWNEIPQAAGLARTGKSCRLRWMNYLRPNLKHGNFTKEEDETILKLHKKHGNRWATIAAKLPGRSDNEIKNHFNTRLRKIAEKRQVRSLDRTSSREASSPVTIDQNYSVSEQNSSSAPTSLDPSPTSYTNYSSSPDTSNLISFGNYHNKITGFEAPEEDQAGDHIEVDQLQFSLARLCMREDNVNYIGEMFGNYEGYGLEECFFNLQGGDNVMLEHVDDISNYFWIDLFNHGSIV